MAPGPKGADRFQPGTKSRVRSGKRPKSRRDECEFHNSLMSEAILQRASSEIHRIVAAIRRSTNVPSLLVALDHLPELQSQVSEAGTHLKINGNSSAIATHYTARLRDLVAELHRVKPLLINERERLRSERNRLGDAASFMTTLRTTR